MRLNGELEGEWSRRWATSVVSVSIIHAQQSVRNCKCANIYIYVYTQREHAQLEQVTSSGGECATSKR